MSSSKHTSKSVVKLRNTLLSYLKIHPLAGTAFGCLVGIAVLSVPVFGLRYMNASNHRKNQDIVSPDGSSSTSTADEGVPSSQNDANASDNSDNEKSPSASPTSSPTHSDNSSSASNDGHSSSNASQSNAGDVSSSPTPTPTVTILGPDSLSVPVGGTSAPFTLSTSDGSKATWHQQGNVGDDPSVPPVVYFNMPPNTINVSSVSVSVVVTNAATVGHAYWIYMHPDDYLYALPVTVTN